MLRITRLACVAAALAAAWVALLQKTTEEPARTAVLLVRGVPRRRLRGGGRRRGGGAVLCLPRALRRKTLQRMLYHDHAATCSATTPSARSSNAPTSVPCASCAGPTRRGAAVCCLPCCLAAAGRTHLQDGARGGGAAAKGAWVGRAEGAAQGGRRGCRVVSVGPLRRRREMQRALYFAPNCSRVALNARCFASRNATPAAPLHFCLRRALRCVAMHTIHASPAPCCPRSPLPTSAGHCTCTGRPGQARHRVLRSYALPATRRSE